jgi:hypothetical protein
MALVEVNTTGLRDKLSALVGSIGGDARRVLRTEMAHLIEDLAGKTTSPKKQRGRISRDFYSAFRTVRNGPPPQLSELYRVIDKFGKGGRRLRTGAAAYYAQRRLHAQRIGFFAAGWYGGGNPTRARKSTAVGKQPSLGEFRTEDRADHYTLTAINKVRFAHHMRGLPIIIQKAVNKRAASIRRNMEIMRLTGKRYQFRE